MSKPMRYRPPLLPLLALLAVASQRSAQAQGLSLRIVTDKSTYFEGEPIIVVEQLVNTGLDTAFVPLFSNQVSELSTIVRRLPGHDTLPGTRVFADYASSPQWRGEAIPPGGSLYETTVVQFWNGAESPGSAYPRNIPPGSYELLVTFDAGARLSNEGPPVSAVPFLFTIRTRSVTEEAWFHEVAGIMSEAYQPKHRSAFMNDMLAWADRRTSEDVSDAFLGYVLNYGVQIARGSGSRVDARAAAHIKTLRDLVLRSQSDRPSGALVVAAIDIETPDSTQGLADRLGPTLAGSFAASRARARRPQAQNRH